MSEATISRLAPSSFFFEHAWSAREERPTDERTEGTRGDPRYIPASSNLRSPVFAFFKKIGEPWIIEAATFKVRLWVADEE